MSCDDVLIKQRDKLATIVDNYGDAIIAVVTNGVESYRLDTGQTVTWVTKLNIKDIQAQYENSLSLYNDLCLRLGGGGTITAVDCV